jgi:hypothetical protein
MPGHPMPSTAQAADLSCCDACYRYNGDDITDYSREHCLRGRTLSFDIGDLDRRTRYAGGKIDPKHTFIGQRLGGMFGMKKVDHSRPCAEDPDVSLKNDRFASFFVLLDWSICDRLFPQLTIFYRP